MCTHTCSCTCIFSTPYGAKHGAYPDAGWFSLRHDGMELNVPASVKVITTQLLATLGLEPHTCSLQAEDRHGDFQFREVQPFNARSPFVLDPAFRVIRVIGYSSGDAQPASTTGVEGAFVTEDPPDIHDGSDGDDDSDDDSDDARTGGPESTRAKQAGDFTEINMGYRFMFLKYDLKPRHVYRGSKLRNWVKNTNKRYQLSEDKSHLVYLAYLRDRKHVVRDLAVKHIRTTRIVPFADEVPEVT